MYSMGALVLCVVCFVVFINFICLYEVFVRAKDEQTFVNVLVFRTFSVGKLVKTFQQRRLPVHGFAKPKYEPIPPKGEFSHDIFTNTRRSTIEGSEVYREIYYRKLLNRNHSYGSLKIE